MTLDPSILAVVLAMAAATYATRLAGILLARRLTVGGRLKAAMAAIPAAVLVAVAAPTALATGWPETAAATATALAATRLPLLGTIAVGVAAIILLRAMVQIAAA